ncbi:type II toxin-antitoxin system HicA family toxin [Sphingomonas sp.]|uniref:type II toxin-antitoxin system HicA family toxin n=1 Tax=Sphingomonas sp. TaxID=28214 RepID=UPI0035BC4E9B
MVQGYTAQVKAILREHGCSFVRPGKGDHEVWSCPNVTRPVVVDGKIMSRHIANEVFKQAKIKARF